MTNIHELVTKHYKESISVSKKMIQKYGTDAAVMMGELISKQKYWDDNGRLVKGRFWWSIRDVQLTTGLKRRAIENSIILLSLAGFIEVKNVPQRVTLYKVNTEAVNDFLDNTVVKRGKEFYHDAVLPVTQGHEMEISSVLPVTQGCATSNTGAVLPVTHTKPITKPNKPRETSSDNGSKGNTEVKELVGLYIQLFEDKTGNKPYITQGKDHKILKTIINNQGLEETKRLLREFFKRDDDFKRKAGYSIGLFSSNINSLLTTSKDGKFPEHRIIET